MVCFDFPIRRINYRDMIRLAVDSLNQSLGTEAFGLWGPSFAPSEADQILKADGGPNFKPDRMNLYPVVGISPVVWKIWKEGMWFMSQGASLQDLVISPQYATSVTVHLNIDAGSIAKRLTMAYQQIRLSRNQG